MRKVFIITGIIILTIISVICIWFLNTNKELYKINLHNKVGFINRNGKVVIEPKFQYANDFENGVSVVIDMDAHKCGLINTKGEVIVPYIYNNLYNCREGFCVFSRDGKKFGYINTKGDTVIEPIYDSANSFHEGLAVVSIGDRYGVINKKGKYKVVTETNCLGTTSGACSATAQVSPIASANANALISGMNSVQLGGATPLVYALDRTVYQDFVPFGTYTPKKIVLITDGGENCGGDPCAFARQLMNKRSDVHIDVVLVSSSSKALACLSNVTGGHFYTVDDLGDFTTTITKSIQTPSTTPVEAPSQKYEYIGN